MTKKKFNIALFGNQAQDERRARIVQSLRECPIPDNELLLNLGLFLVPQALSRILFMDFLYRQILDVQGVILDLGTRWGQNLALFTNLRGIHEPFNRLRKVIGFDTFAGFPAIQDKDGQGRVMQPGNYAVSDSYEKLLESLIDLHEQESPLDHIKKHEIVKGNASQEINGYLKRNPETIVALAYFDFDLYQPTKKCLLAIRDRLTRGSVVGFDELNDHECPGETLAVMEVLGLRKQAVKRFPGNSRTSYVVID